MTDKTTHVYACQMTTTGSVKQHKLRKLIAWLSAKEAAGMNFVSLYIPQRTSISEVIAYLRHLSDSDTEKEKGTQDRLQITLKSLIQHLKQRTEISNNGVAVFAGTFTDNDSGREVATVQELIPPEPIVTYSIKIDDHFHFETLREMLRNPKIIGIIAMDSKEASFGLLDGEQIELIENISSGVSGKSGKGGQSQRRYERERDMELSYFFHRVAEHAAKSFLENRKIMALAVGGPGQTKEDFVKGNYLHYELKNALLKIVDTQSTGKEGVKEILEKSSDAVKDLCWPEEKMAMNRLLTELNKQSGLAIYGLDSIVDALKIGAVEVVIVADNTDVVEIDVLCKKCGLMRKKITNNKTKIQTEREIISSRCERCNAQDYEVGTRDIVDVLEDLASQTDAKVEVISTESEEKIRLAALGGVAAILRYR